ncbi:MAG: 6-phosphogluconate dehydrogenase NAD-binding protein [Mycobacterium sp.]|jgi:3-hydroxyisobutyrate dehydrogenase-like beta-hydroxyacid dehydrogenase|nr:6-phosphogluconate dehydrogenase NAD-binding protein [Mycobacterium sp.]
MTTSPRVGVIGTGALGSRLAHASLDRGLDTTVWNRTVARTRPLTAAGARLAPTIGQLVHESDVVVIVVSTADDVRSALRSPEVRLDGRTVVTLTSTTPGDATALHGEATARGARYLDGAAMGGTRRVGDPSAMYFYSGDRSAFDVAAPALRAFGTPLFLGVDPGHASRYDTAVLGVIMGYLTAAHQGLALLRPHGVSAVGLASLLRDYTPYIVDLFVDQAQQLDVGSVTAEDGSVDVYRAALQHLRDGSAEQGVDTVLTDAIASVLERVSAAGRGDDGLAALADAFTSVRAR